MFCGTHEIRSCVLCQHEVFCIKYPVLSWYRHNVLILLIFFSQWAVVVLWCIMGTFVNKIVYIVFFCKLLKSVYIPQGCHKGLAVASDWYLSFSPVTLAL